jgi:adenylate kinase family enzyme
MGSANDRRWLILVIGLPGSGKTTICAALRASIPDSVEWDFDDAMPEAFKAKMRNGQVITEDERDNLITVWSTVRCCRRAAR